jgi:sulfite exporter TauE/SafE
MAQVGRVPGDAGEGRNFVIRALSIPYHLGRAFTYVMLGFVAASMSQYLVGTPVQRLVAGAMLFTAGVLFFTKALPAFAPFRGRIQMPGFLKVFSQQVAELAAPFSGNTDIKGRFFYGVMLGFLPCGLVLAAVMAAASTGDPLVAIFGMAAFAIGTMPSLMLVGLGSGLAQQRWPLVTRQISNTVMALNGLILCVVALRLAV